MQLLIYIKYTIFQIFLHSKKNNMNFYIKKDSKCQKVTKVDFILRVQYFSLVVLYCQFPPKKISYIASNFLESSKREYLKN